MPITIKYHLYGTTARLGVTSSRQTSATIYALASGIDNDATGITDAIDQAYSDIGTDHPVYTTLPLQTIEGRRWGPDKAWLTLRFFRTGYTGPSSTFGRMSMRTDVDPIEMYRVPFDQDGNVLFDEYGLPAGDLIGDPYNENITPGSYIWQRPILWCQFRALLAANPINSVINLVQHVNNDAFVIDDISFQPGTLMFRGTTTDAIEVVDGTTTSVKYPTAYNFRACGGGYRRQNLVAEREEPTEAYPFGKFVKWTTTVSYDGLPFANFTGQFPTA